MRAWLTHDAAACLAIRNYLPLAECAHFRQHKTAKALYNAVVARYSSPATAALGRLILPYLFPEQSAFATVEELVVELFRGERCWKPHTQHRCFSRLDDAWRTLFGDEAERPLWAELLRSGVAIFDLDYDVILAAIYALSVSAKGDCYLCVPPDPGIEATALGASESVLLGTAPAEALHTFTLDSGASRCLFRDSTTRTPLPAPVPVRLADPSGGPVLAHSSTVLPCPAVPSGSLSGLNLPSFFTNLVSTAAVQDAMVTTTTRGGQRVSICTCTETGRHLATFNCPPESSLYTLATELTQVAASAQVSASGQVAPPCSCRLLSHQTLLWHHRLGHPSLPRLRGMHSRLLVFGLPRSLPPLPPSPAPPCLPCIEGRQRAAPHSSSFPPTTAPLQTLHVDVWVPARVSGQGCKRYFLLVFDDYPRYTTVFPLRNKGEVVDVLIPWISAVRLQLRERTFVMGRAFSSRSHFRIAERRIGLVMEVARTSMIHEAAPHFLWPFLVLYAAHQLNLWPRVSLPETSPTLRWTGKVGDASDVTFDKSVPFDRLFPYRSAPLPPPPLFLAPGPPPVDPSPPQGPAALGVSQVEPLLGTVPIEVTIDSGAARGTASGNAELAGAGPGGTKSKGARSGGAEPGGAEPEGAEPAGAEPGGAKLEGAEPRGLAGASPQLSPLPGPLSPLQLREWFAQRTRLWSGAAGAGDSATGGTGAGGAGATSLGGSGAAGAGGVGGARTRGIGAAGAGGAAGVGARGIGVEAAGGTGAAGLGGARTGGTGAAGAGGAVRVGAGGTGAGAAGGTGAAGADGAAGVLAGDTGARGACTGGGGAAGASSGDTGWPRPYFVPLLQQSLPPLQPASPLPAPSPYIEQTGGFTECREPVSHLASPVRAVSTGRHVPGTHHMPLRPSSVPQCVPLPSPPASSRGDSPDPESDLVCAANPTVPRLLATLVTNPSFASAAASALVAELVDFAAAYRLDYAASLVAEFKSDCPPSVGGEFSLGTVILEDRQEEFKCIAAAVPHLVSMLIAPEGHPDAPDIPTLRSYTEMITGLRSTQWQTAMDAKMASWKSTSTYIDAFPPPGANIVDGMCIS
ncbi:unnamed protein product [Closterium sp. NIES-54]